MTPLSYLALPAVTVTVGCLWLWVRSRKPQSLSSGIDDFRREMQALSPENDHFGSGRKPGAGSA